MSWKLTSLDTYIIPRPNSGFFFTRTFYGYFCFCETGSCVGLQNMSSSHRPCGWCSPGNLTSSCGMEETLYHCQVCDTASALVFIIFMVIAAKIELLIRKVGLQSVPLGGEPFDYSPKLTDCPRSSPPPSRLHAFLQWPETS